MDSKLNNNTPVKDKRASSSYAEIYFQNDYCEFHQQILNAESEQNIIEPYKEDGENWVSPSDLIIDKIELKPPFTSKITRGKTHEGILEIGNSIIENEREGFLSFLKGLLTENDNCWEFILENERKYVKDKLNSIYKNILEHKSKIMTKEITEFYEKTLEELEHHLRSELNSVLTSNYAKTISDLNIEIKEKLMTEKKILENVLKKRYTSEVNKITKYYKLLLDNELERNNRLVNEALCEKNDALKAYFRHIETENITSAMYVMSSERKKCKIKRFLVDSYQTMDITEKMQELIKKQHVMDNYARHEVHISQINKDWEEKIRKIVKLFLKFISFSLKLLPEQSTFLLDLEKLVVLQMNELQKLPHKSLSILQSEDKLFDNVFKFEECESKTTTCKDTPFSVVGNLSDPPLPKYGSRETLPSEVDLPYIRVDRQFIYAKCHNFEQVKDLLESQRCKCMKMKLTSQCSTTSSATVSLPPSPSPTDILSLDEPLLISDIERLHHCPARTCQNWAKRNSFPYMNAYLDFTEENFKKVITILGNPAKQSPPNLIDPKEIVKIELPFEATKELYRNAETQYSSQENLHEPDVACTCFDNLHFKDMESSVEVKDTPSEDMTAILHKRKVSLRNLIKKNPNLLKIFTDECFDFQL